VDRPSQQANHPSYFVNLEAKTCTCLDHQDGGFAASIIHAARFVYQREFQFDAETGTTTEIETVVMQTVKKTSYRQNWPAYDRAQINEKSTFQVLLRDLCKGIVEPRTQWAGHALL